MTRSNRRRSSATASSCARGFAGVAGTLALIVALPARADPPPRPIRVAYTASSECPGAADFTAQILARTTRVRTATSGEAADDVRVTIAAHGDRFDGHLELLDAGGRATNRDVSDVTCADVASALALV